MSFNDFSMYINEEQRQNINLSAYAWNVISNDMIMFYSSTCDANNISGFLNIIMKNYLFDSPIALSHHAKILSTKYSNLLGANNENLLSSLVEFDIKEISDKLLIYPKGEGKKMRISNSNLMLLSEIHENSWEYKIFEKPGKLLKALFETYARLPYFERERIFYKHYIEIIRDSIALNRQLKVVTESNNAYMVAPYEIKTDILSNYNYLVGWSAEYDPLETKHQSIASFRLSKIKDMQRLHTSFLLTPDKKVLIEKEIAKKGVQFLIGNSEEISVKLSPCGISGYNNRLYLRPQYTRIEKNNIYVFDATQTQIEFYFFKFGADAEILFPLSLRENFISQYREALKTYSSL